MQNPAQFKIPAWFLNRQKDIVDGKDAHVVSNQIDQKMREDLERLKKIRSHRGLRHFWGLKVKGRECTQLKTCSSITPQASKGECACACVRLSLRHLFLPIALDLGRCLESDQSTPRPPVDDATSESPPRSKSAYYYFKETGSANINRRGRSFDIHGLLFSHHLVAGSKQAVGARRTRDHP